MYEGGAWRLAEELPGPRKHPAGVNAGGVLYITGGGDPDDYRGALSEILSWEPETQSWLQAGNMAEGRRDHAVTAVPQSVVTQYCD